MGEEEEEGEGEGEEEEEREEEREEEEKEGEEEEEEGEMFRIANKGLAVPLIFPLFSCASLHTSFSR